jgi:hypothetical protein
MPGAGAGGARATNDRHTVGSGGSQKAHPHVSSRQEREQVGIE